MPASSAPPALEMRDAYKSFGFIRALEGVSFTLEQGEIHALLGDNGAGKSTLIKAVAGVHALDRGEILVKGEPVQISSPSAARAHGIETVFQDLAVFDNLNVLENFFMGREEKRPRFLGPLAFLSRRSMERHWREYLERLQVHIQDSDQQLGLMSGGQRQAVAVARAVAFASEIVILDEPTAALGLRESAQVLDLIGRLPEQGVSVILISHNMRDVMQLADRATVLRQGRLVGECEATEANEGRIVAMIMGARSNPSSVAAGGQPH
jgi:D-xylose transport system ATP-binding protein